MRARVGARMRARVGARVRVPAVGGELLLLEEAVDEQRELGEATHSGDQPAVTDAPLGEIVRARLTEQAGLDTVHAVQLVRALALLTEHLVRPCPPFEHPLLPAVHLALRLVRRVAAHVAKRRNPGRE